MNKPLNRRQVSAGLAALPFLVPAPWSATSAIAQILAPDEAFDADTVKRLARQLAEKPYKAPDQPLPGPLKDLSYDQYRDVRFKVDNALWRSERLPYEVQFFHRGFVYTDRVEVYDVAQGKVRPIVYSPDLFTFGKAPTPAADAKLGFAGFRLHAPLNRQDYYDEVGAFLGASYFRAVARGLGYGISARGLALKTGDPGGEEFPAFRAFFIERPAKTARSITVHALLDSESTTAACRFVIQPGVVTTYDVEIALYPRVKLEQAGIAPLTSMFLFDANNRSGIDDFRPAVHDSDGLALRNGRGEEIWRPLSNRAALQISAFQDTNPRGFGLLQRERDFREYQDLESRFEKRPSLWVEPLGDWGEGAVYLVEIPSKEEIHDNVVAFWRPKDAMEPKREHTFAYRLHWGGDKAYPPPLAQFAKTRVGAGPEGARLFVLDLAGDSLRTLDAGKVTGAVTADKGEIRHIVSQPNAATGGWRISFELAPGRAPLIELRAQLMAGETALSEVWLYRWTP